MACRLIAIFAALTVVGAGCAADPALEPSSIAAGIATAIVPADPSVVTDVMCPEPEPQMIAQSLTCTASLNNRSITVDVVIDEEGGATSVVRERLLDLADVEVALGERLIEDLETVPVGVECAGELVVDAVGVTFDCVATHDDRPLTFVIEIVDDKGTWTATFTLAD